ncbi:MAG: hypothetical protein KDD53_02535, partial [Bdellovibrionales bacterium]|nr:hypothetical protein [Bdellovibrionales bacterium]
WKKVSASDSNERFLKEMEGFLAGKLLLEREETRSKGWSELKELAQKGTYWRALAALTLARMTVAAADKADVLALLEAVEKEQPEQSDLIRGELDRLGQSAKEISQE